MIFDAVLMQAGPLTARYAAANSTPMTGNAGQSIATTVNVCTMPETGAFDNSRSSYYLAVAGGLATLPFLAGCDNPRPTPQNREAEIPANQTDCPIDGGGSEFCRQLARTEHRIDNMRAGVDEYANHNRDLTYLGIGGGIAFGALIVYLRMRGKVKKALAQATAVQPLAPQPPSPTPVAADGPKGKTGVAG